ncbi:MAG: tetratricopeptide repeat protein [Alphaproteobacteria bacterium]|nr:tetratricopeptide repeat protein [Alphaproteobacteria bacterium]
MTKFRDAVNVPHKKAGVARRNIAKMHPQKTPGKIMRGVGMGAAGMTEFLLWLAKFAAFDNHITRAMERRFARMNVGKKSDGTDKKIPAFLHKRPELSSYLVYWMIVAILVGGGAFAYNKINDDAENKTEIKESDFAPGTFGAYREKMCSITPYLICNLIACEGVKINDNGMHYPYLDSRGIWTVGFGSTMLKDGTRVTKDTKPITTDEAYELARWHIEDGETFYFMYCWDVGYENIDINTPNLALGIGSIMYNANTNLIASKNSADIRARNAALRQIYADSGYAVTSDMVRTRFAQNPVNNMYSFGKAWTSGRSIRDVANTLGNFCPEGGGMHWRRWLEAGMLTGDITPQMLLDCPIGGMYEFYCCMNKNKESFWRDGVANRDTYKKFRQWVVNPVNAKGISLANWKRTRDYMPEYVLAFIDGREPKLDGKIAESTITLKRDKVERETYLFNYDVAYNAAITAYKNANYDSAANMLNALVLQNPDNALLRNDLAVVYNELGRPDDAIAQVREILKRIGDKSQYSAAWYNAGVAYEQKGDLQSALKNYKLAVANGSRRVQTDVQRVTNLINKQSKPKGYKKATNMIQNKTNASAAARKKFNSRNNKSMV